MSKIGPEHRALGVSVLNPAIPSWRQVRGWTRTIAVLAVILGLAAISWSAPDSLFATLNRLAAVHAGLAAGFAGAALGGALFVVSGVAGAFITILEAIPGIALSGAMLAATPAEKPADATPPQSPAGQEATSQARPEMQVGFYAGRSWSPPSDVHLKSPDGTDLTIKNIKWKAESFKPSPYYGGRGIDWNSRMPQLGLMVDFTHAKATAIRGQTITHHGTHKGKELPPSGPFESIFRKLEFTHGLNSLTLNGLFRLTGLNRRAVPYVGVGVGFMVPHALAWRTGQTKQERVHEAQLTGIAAQILGGIEWRIFKNDRRSLFTEYKFAYTTNDVELKDSGSVVADISVHQFIFGAYFTPWRAGQAAAR